VVCGVSPLRICFFQAEDGIRDFHVTGVQTCALPILHSRTIAIKLALIGRTAIHLFDPALMAVGTSSAGPGDVLLVVCEHGQEPALCHTARLFRKRGGKVVSITRHTANALRAHADIALLVSAHDPRPQMELLLYQAALQHLLDLVFLMLCEDEAHLRMLEENGAPIE